MKIYQPWSIFVLAHCHPHQAFWQCSECFRIITTAAGTANCYNYYHATGKAKCNNTPQVQYYFQIITMLLAMPKALILPKITYCNGAIHDDTQARKSQLLFFKLLTHFGLASQWMTWDIISDWHFCYYSPLNKSFFEMKQAMMMPTPPGVNCSYIIKFFKNILFLSKHDKLVVASHLDPHLTPYLCYTICQSFSLNPNIP